MEERKSVRQEKGKMDPEAMLSLFLILFVIGVVVFTLIFVIGAFSNGQSRGEEPDKEQTQTNTSGVEQQQPTVPVFSGGSVLLPSQTNATQVISESLNSGYAVLVNAETGEIVASKQASERFSPASMTKVMTLIVACEQLKQSDLDRKLTFTQEDFDYVTTGSYAGTEQVIGAQYVGDSFLIRDLLYGIGVSSAADCTYLICREISGSEESFVALMNAKAAALGLTQTHFDNIIGYESDANYTTARDMAAIMIYAMQCDLIRQILCTKSFYSYQGYYENELGEEASYRRGFNSTLNDRLESYQNVFGSSFCLKTATLLGGKTGYLKENGVVNNCLVSYLSSNDSSAAKYVLVLGCNSRSSAYTMQDVKTIADTYLN